MSWDTEHNNLFAGKKKHVHPIADLRACKSLNYYLFTFCHVAGRHPVGH